MSYEYENQCGSCKEYKFEGDYKKGYCAYYRAYYYPDDSCQHYDERGGSGGCWLTSACCKAKGLPDDCEELTKLRAFRDQVLLKMPGGQDLIDFYYAEAPRIVNQIESSEKQAEIYQFIYEKITEIIAKTDKEQHTQAVTDYLFMMYLVDLKSKRS